GGEPDEVGSVERGAVDVAVPVADHVEDDGGRGGDLEGEAPGRLARLPGDRDRAGAQEAGLHRAHDLAAAGARPRYGARTRPGACVPVGDRLDELDGVGGLGGPDRRVGAGIDAGRRRVQQGEAYAQTALYTPGRLNDQTGAR